MSAANDPRALFEVWQDFQAAGVAAKVRPHALSLERLEAAEKALGRIALAQPILFSPEQWRLFQAFCGPGYFCGRGPSPLAGIPWRQLPGGQVVLGFDPEQLRRFDLPLI